MSPQLEISGGAQRCAPQVGVSSNDWIARSFAAAWNAAEEQRDPFRHWLISNALPPDVLRAIVDLPIPPPAIADTRGKRETHNALRVFFSGRNLEDHPVCAAVACAFQEPRTVCAFEARAGIDLNGSFLRIEYCQDTAGFYLERHTDVGAKLVTMMLYLSAEAGSADWGTDFYRPDGTHAGRAHSSFNSGYLFLPGAETWHGFEPREIAGVRRALIVNYVKPEWRSCHELAFPDRPVA